MNSDMRIREVYRRVGELRERRARRIDGLLAAGSAASGVMTLIMVALLSGGRGSPAGSGFYGASQIFEGAGGYVLVAVLAFVAATAATLLGVRFRDRRKDKDRTDDKEADEGKGMKR